MRGKIKEEQRDIAKIFALNVQIFLRVENFFPKITALLSRQKRGTKEKNVLEFLKEESELQFVFFC